ncbi:MAG: tyrosine-type recombinase/integrase, partial [Planctomycetales bacterium]
MGSLRKKTYTKPLPPNAELFTKKNQQFAKWVDGRGKKQSAPTTTGRDGSLRIVLETGRWLAKYRDASGAIREIATGCRDRSAAQTVLTDLERRAELIRSGVLKASEEAIAGHSTRPISQHFEAYHEHRVTQELNETRIKNTDSRLKRLARECDFHRLADLAGEPFTRWLGLQLEQGMGAGTRNEYHKELTGFANWCIHTGRLTSNPFSKIPRANVKADQRRKRRALAEPELEKLLHVARWRPLAEYGRKTVHLESTDNQKRSNWKKAPITYETLEAVVTHARQQLAGNPGFMHKLGHRGRERALIYRALVLTGLRRGELDSLTIGSLELDAPTPFAILNAADEKNGEGSEIPLRADLVVELRQWIEDKRKDFTGEPDEFNQQPLFAVPASLLRALNRDLAAAGIPKKDHRGRTVDVHAMRTTLATMLNKSGVAPRTAQEIMRHSDIRLTMDVYTDAKLLDVSGALDQLPKLSSVPTDTTLKAMRATGTFGELPRKVPPMLPPATAQNLRSESTSVILTTEFGSSRVSNDSPKKQRKPTKKALSKGFLDKASESGRQDLNLRPLHPQCS